MLGFIDLETARILDLAGLAIEVAGVCVWVRGGGGEERGFGGGAMENVVAPRSFLGKGGDGGGGGAGGEEGFGEGEGGS